MAEMARAQAQQLETARVLRNKRCADILRACPDEFMLRVFNEAKKYRLAQIQELLDLERLMAQAVQPRPPPPEIVAEAEEKPEEA